LKCYTLIHKFKKFSKQLRQKSVTADEGVL
jgi:hypothetical protein